MRPPLPYGQSEDAFSGFGAGKFRFLLYACVPLGKFAAAPEKQTARCPIGIEDDRRRLRKKSFRKTGKPHSRLSVRGRRDTESFGERGAADAGCDA